jgi:hypothetical protein
MTRVGTQLRLFLTLAVTGLALPLHAVGAVGDKGTMEQACRSGDARLQKLCQIVNAKFGGPQDSYVHLGGEFYLVSVTNTGRVAQGIYVGNVRSGQLNLYGGYGSPELGEVLRQDNGALWIGVTRRSMSRGHFGEGQSLLELRINPITKMPFLITHDVFTETGLSEEMQAFCSRPGNRKNPECTGLGKTTRLSQGDINRLRSRAAVDPTITQRIVAAHNQAIRAYKRKKFEGKNPFEFLENAGIWRIVDTKPSTMSTSQYVQVLNDYAFFAYGYGEGRNDLAIEVLDKVIKLDPRRSVAYLNMAEALENLAKYGGTEYSTMPLDEQTIAELKISSATYRDKYQSMLRQPK